MQTKESITESINYEPLSEMEEIYKENIIDHYKNPRNKGQLANYTFSHEELNPLCGDKIKVFVIIKDDIIVNISFIGDGCAISQASISLLSDHVKGKNIVEVKKLLPENIYDLLGIKISHTRSKCALLSLKTIQKGIEEKK